VAVSTEHPAPTATSNPPDSDLLLDVRDLAVHFTTNRGIVKAVDGVNLTLRKGGSLGIVGESGSGKTQTTRAIIRVLPSTGRTVRGQVFWKGQDLLQLPSGEVRALRGSQMVVVPQDPMTSLNPVYNLGNQVGEPLVHHRQYGWSRAKQEAARFLSLVRIPMGEKRIHQYPHEFSGGMRQRSLIAMGLTCDPELIIADEPTTALDVTVQSQILDLLRDVQQRTGSALILVTHDLALVARMCENIAVMYGGRVVEQGPTRDIFKNPVHPYTEALLQSLPIPGDTRDRLYSIEGQPPDPLNWTSGCRFAPRCRYARPEFFEEYPPVTNISKNHTVACWLAKERADNVDEG
jgi:oligopeptide/dipeptide ABC transporter ATP-binding protein